MPQFILDGPHLPPPDLFLFLIPVSLQCLFLHPIFPSTLSRLLRFALMPLSVAMSFATPYKYAIEPRNQAVGMNFVFGIMGAYGIMKSIEWGFATDLLPYTWVGFDGKSPAEEEKAAQVNGNAGGVDNEPREKKMQKRRRTEEAQREYLAGLRRKQAAQDGPIDIIRSTMHLLIAMRGQGYDFGATTTQPFALDHGQFLRRLLLEIAWSHPLLVLCAAILLEPPTSRDAFIYATLPSLNAQHAHMLGGCVTGLAMGTAVFAALTLGYSCCTLITFVVTAIVRLLPLPEALTLPRFDPREYPPLFILSSPPDSVAKFWSVQWHAFFDHSASSPSTRRSACFDRSLASSLVAHSAFSPRSPCLPGYTSLDSQPRPRLFLLTLRLFLSSSNGAARSTSCRKASESSSRACTRP
ncbi:RHTO0S05e09164g1_1 [Rhodotorula toruloides]|uniref:RHTO0S05e09164g1_1 n=1 Tax=Rhodotorula toruloides TaxID=5286 RepID=A0A061AUT1_RHOTO|nr:RHTO0S05e09164g1_1 [Rhodotorula toruloides]